jgi:hypothetical protein
MPYGERFRRHTTNVWRCSTCACADDVEIFAYRRNKSVKSPSVCATSTARSGARGAPNAALVILRYVSVIGNSRCGRTFTQRSWLRLLSVTDERMTRYWISMDEAIWSIVLTARCVASADVAMPACGEPVPIVETASRLAGWYRPGRVPYPINRTGIRPGERLHEVLLSPNESFVAGPGPGLRGVQSTRPPSVLDQLPDRVRDLPNLVERGDREALARACLERRRSVTLSRGLVWRSLSRR